MISATRPRYDTILEVTVRADETDKLVTHVTNDGYQTHRRTDPGHP